MNEKNDVVIESMIDDIERKESDLIMSHSQNGIVNTKITIRKPKIKRLLAYLKANPITWIMPLVAVVLVLISLVVFQNFRYRTLNYLGVKVAMRLTVVDSGSKKPVMGAKVTVGTAEQVTDESGGVMITNLRQGKTIVSINKKGFAQVTNKYVLGLGSNPLGQIQIEPKGEQYQLSISDRHTGGKLAMIEFSFDDQIYRSDSDGMFTITTDPGSNADDIQLLTSGYRKDKYVLDRIENKIQNIEVVSEKMHAFVSQRNGVQEIYANYFDAKDEKLLVKSTGYERDDTVVLNHPSKNIAILSSTRANVRNTDGFLLTTAYVVYFNTEAQMIKIAESERINIVGWAGDSLIYTQIVSGTSAANPKRSEVKSYDVITGETKELMSANYFNDVKTIAEKVAIAPSSYAVGSDLSKLYIVDPATLSIQKISDNEVWKIYSSSPQDLIVSAADSKWYKYRLNQTLLELLSPPPANPLTLDKNFVIDTKDNTYYWTEKRDGKGLILGQKFGTDADKIKVIAEIKGLNSIVMVNSGNMVYRIYTESESADYHLNINKSDIVTKLNDVQITGQAQNYYGF
jgi:hypothetical protein